VSFLYRPAPTSGAGTVQRRKENFLVIMDRGHAGTRYNPLFFPAFYLENEISFSIVQSMLWPWCLFLSQFFLPGKTGMPFALPEQLPRSRRTCPPLILHQPFAPFFTEFITLFLFKKRFNWLKHIIKTLENQRVERNLAKQTKKYSFYHKLLSSV